MGEYMKLLFLNCLDKRQKFEQYINDNICGDYIYDYPPRQSYRKFESDIWNNIKYSLDKSDEINLYFHFPFCKQICAFCNLFTINDISCERFDEYFDTLYKELDFYEPYILGKKINTIYLGGGTPSWIPSGYFKRLFDRIEKIFDVDIKNIDEVSIELSPETAKIPHLKEYYNIGINRVNIGVQAVDSEELSCIGRKYNEKEIFTALENVMSIGFKNVCVDLIYGLEGQTMESWKQSLNYVERYLPQTICPYPLTLRPKTGFDKHGYIDLDGKLQYEKYEYARNFLLKCGYEQETHVRYKLKNSQGGYIQKENHWKQQNILGLGAGARSYLYNISYRNGYSIINRKKAYDLYLNMVEKKSNGIVDGFVMDRDEIIRKYIVLGLNNLDIFEFKKTFGVNPYELFPEEFDILFKNNIIVERHNKLFFTEKGLKYRDIAIQLFFSNKVNELINEHSYTE